MGSTAAAHHSFGSQHRTEAPSKLPVTLGIFTDDANHLAHTDFNAPSDLWTAAYLLRSEAALYGGASMLEMSMPVCPFTIVLEKTEVMKATSPAMETNCFSLRESLWDQEIQCLHLHEQQDKFLKNRLKDAEAYMDDVTS